MLGIARYFCQAFHMAQPAVIAPPEAWQRVGQAVAERRIELHLTQDQLGASKAVVSNLENAKQASFARGSLVRICQALEWTNDSIDRLLRGDDPVDLVPQRHWTPETTADLVNALLDDFKDLNMRLRAVEQRLGLNIDLDDAALAAKGGRPDVVIEPPQPGDAPEDPG